MRFAAITAAFLLMTAARAVSLCDTVAKIVDAPSFYERAIRIRSLYSSGIEAIPRLIDEVSSSRRVSVILSDPKSSNIEGPLWTYCGVVAAYLIETLLSRSDLALEPLPQPEGDLFLGINSDDYVYTRGIIRKKNGALPGRGDLRKIHDIYWRWWQSHRTKTLADIRRELGNELRPLTGSEYHWE
jgi:hypothetical protein